MYLITYDLGTGGVKAALYDEKLHVLGKTFIEYKTFFPRPDYHEQRPEDWWKGIVKSTHLLLEQTGVRPLDVRGIALSGQSLTAIPLDENGKELLDKVPIWSDSRAVEESRIFFAKTDPQRWYNLTGNGFPAPCYTLFKLMWMQKHQPEVYKKTAAAAGSKDYINYKLTGKLYTDYSYASGSGGYHLMKMEYHKEFWEAAGIDIGLLPEIVPSDTILGNLTEDAALELGLTRETVVAAGGVDNACMALGATGITEGAAYVSLGSSSWVPVTASRPVLDYVTKPYVFAHIEPGMYTSAYSIFAGGSSLRWVRDNLYADFKESPYEMIDKIALESPPGANGILFNPSLAGGTSQDKSVNIKGAFAGLSLANNRGDIARAVLEGIALNLKQSIGFLRKNTALKDEILFCGGGSKSAVWLQIFADVLNVNILKTNIDQDTASLGAAAVAAKGMGWIKDYGAVGAVHRREALYLPDPQRVKQYDKISEKFDRLAEMLSDFGDFTKETE